MSREIKYDSIGGDATLDPIAKFLDGATERLRITQAGKLALGTTAPEANTQVDIKGSSGSAGAITSLHAQTTLLLDNSISHTVLSIIANSTAAAQIIFGKNADGQRGRLSYDLSNDSLTLNTANANRLTIDSSGRIGVNTSAPGALLDVRGDAIFNEDGADKDLRVEGDIDPNLLFIDASTDRIGIGTNAPTDKLTISGSLKINGDGSFDGANVFNDSGADKDLRAEGDTDQNLLFLDASADKVGVGTGAPSEKLHINGNLKIEDGKLIKLPKIAEASIPTGSEGDMFYCTTHSDSNVAHRLWIHNGTSWKTVSWWT